MEHEARLTQDSLQVAHANREQEVHEPLYGLAPEPGGGGPDSVGDGSQPSVEAPVEEPAAAGDNRTNLTWGIVLGGVLLLFLLTAILYLGIGSTYSSSPLTNYPLK
jgi:hypothetical protein